MPKTMPTIMEELPEDIPPFASYDLPELTPAQELAAYLIYVETGGEPYEPLESRRLADESLNDAA